MMAGWSRRLRAVLSRLLAWCARRPLLTVALVGVAFIGYQWWWISRYRFLGAFDTDEGAGVATTLSFHRALASGPWELRAAMLSTGNGPLVPTMAVPFVVVFGRTAVSPMFVQAVMVAVSAVAAAGSVLRLSGRNGRAAILAGVCVLAMPALITSSRTDQFSTGVGMFMVVALWALATSDRGRRGWALLAYGAACGAMTLSRTMAVSFLPAMGLALILGVDLRSSRVRRNLVLVVVGALVVGGEWWYRQGDYVYAYLVGHGYGSRAGIYGSTGLGDRLTAHLAYLLRDFRLFLPLGLVVAGSSLAILGETIAERGRAAWTMGRDLWPVWAMALGGSAALLSSPNRGFWFATPLDTLLVVAVVATGARAFVAERSRSVPARAAAVAGIGVVSGWVIAEAGPAAWLSLTLAAAVWVLSVVLVAIDGPRVGARLGALALVLAMVTIAASFPGTGPADQFGVGRSLREQVAGGLERWQPTVYESDPRFRSSDVDERRAVAEEWAAVSRQIDRYLREHEQAYGGPVPAFGESILGVRALIDGNSIAIARELGPRGVMYMQSVNSNDSSEQERQASLTPRFPDGVPRVLVVIAGRSEPFPDGIGWEEHLVRAVAVGWRPRFRVALPTGGEVAIYTHPESEPPR